MLNLTPGSTNNVIIYADTLSGSVGNYFMVILTNAYSRQTFAVNANVVRRNSRFVELSFDTVTVQQYSHPLDGKVYLYPEGNYDYIVFNTNAPTTDPSSPIPCVVWNTDEDFWNFSNTIWNVCGLVDAVEVDRGQAFLYTNDVCDKEIEFVPYISDNEELFNVVYVTSIPMANFPCVVEDGEFFTVETDTITYCDPVLIKNGGIVKINQNIFLKQIPSPYEQC